MPFAEMAALASWNFDRALRSRAGYIKTFLKYPTIQQFNTSSSTVTSKACQERPSLMMCTWVFTLQRAVSRTVAAWMVAKPYQPRLLLKQTKISGLSPLLSTAQMLNGSGMGMVCGIKGVSR